jgi:DNA primase
MSNSNEEVAIVIDYLAQRYVKPETINFHKIGYCLSDDDIPYEINYYGKKEEEIRDDDRGYDYFIRGKIVVPIYEEFGKIVGFATRKPSFEAGNTWWNLSKPFKKGNHLHLMDKVRKDVFENNKIYLVEGYMDAIILHQEGLREVVSIMGTNLSPRKIGLISRYCNNVCLCMDVDENKAGQKAQNKAIYMLKKFDCCESISIIDGLPIGIDPDEYVAENGLQSLLNKERKLSDVEINKIYKEVAASNRRI